MGEESRVFKSQNPHSVALLDVRMPDRGGIDVLHDLLAADPNARVVMLTTSDVEEDVFRAIEDGAMGYVMKESPVETIAAVGDSVADILKEIGLEHPGAPGTTAALALLNDQVKKGGVMASSYVGELLGHAPVMKVSKFSCDAMIARKGRIPAPIHSFKN